MSDCVEEHEAPSVYERKGYVNIVKEDDDGSNDELSDEECMAPQDTDDEDQRSQALGSVYERKDYVNIVKEDDDGSNDELSDEECMTPQDTDDEDQRSQALDSGRRQNAERFPPRGDQTLTEATARKKAPTKPTTQAVTQKQTPHQARVLNVEKYRTQSQDVSSSSSKDKKKSSGGK